jgi:hypothetical protein
MVLFLFGCLLLADAPDGARCEDADCFPYKCSDYGNECEDYCVNDNECADGFVCPVTECEEACVSADCPNGFLCDDLDNECSDICFDNRDCQAGWACCDTFDESVCPDYAECYRP